MPLPLTFASFALLTAGIVLLRLFWRRLHVRVNLLLIALSCGALLLCGLSAVTKWKMYPESLHASLYWAAVAGYELLLLLFTLLRPQVVDVDHRRHPDHSSAVRQPLSSTCTHLRYNSRTRRLLSAKIL